MAESGRQEFQAEGESVCQGIGVLGELCEVRCYLLYLLMSLLCCCPSPPAVASLQLWETTSVQALSYAWILPSPALLASPFDYN